MAGVERAKGFTRTTYVEAKDPCAAEPALLPTRSQRFWSDLSSRISRASNHADNMPDDAPEAADLLGFY